MRDAPPPFQVSGEGYQQSYQIIVADAANAVSVNFSGRCKIFTDLTRKIGIFDRFYAKKWYFLRI